jgi:hypothetical protein
MFFVMTDQAIKLIVSIFIEKINTKLTLNENF